MAASVAGARQGAAATALRLAGASYAEVAEALDLSGTSMARQMVETHLGATADAEIRDEVRKTDSARLERLLRSVWPKATTPGDPEHLVAVRVAVAIIDRHLRLHGADAPAEIVVHAPTVAEIDAWVAHMTTATVAPLAALEANVVEDG